MDVKPENQLTTELTEQILDALSKVIDQGARRVDVDTGNFKISCYTCGMIVTRLDLKRRF